MRVQQKETSYNLDFSMGRLQIEDGVHQREEEINSKKEEESPLAPPQLPQLKQGKSSQGLPREWKFFTNHPRYQIIGNPSIRVRTKSSLRNIYNNLAFISQIEHKKLNDAIVDEN